MNFKQMIMKQPNVNVCIEGKDEATPLHAAVSSGSYEITRMLVSLYAGHYLLIKLNMLITLELMFTG